MAKLKSDNKIRPLIPQNYEAFVQKILLIFLHQRVYDINTQKLIPLNPFPENFAKEDEKLIGEEIPYFDEVSKGLRQIYTLEKRELIDVDLKTYFTTKQERKQYQISSEQTQQHDNKKNQEEQYHYNNHKVDPQQIKKLKELQEEHQIKEAKQQQKDELDMLLDAYDPEIEDENNNENAQNDDDLNENFVKFGESYKYSEDFLIQKKNNVDYTQYLENLCNTFLEDFQAYLQEEDSQVRVATKVVRRQTSNISEEKIENEEQPKQTNLVSSIKKLNNPFAIKKQKIYQPDSLEDFSIKKKENIDVTPSKKVVIENKVLDKNESKLINQKDNLSSQKSITSSSKKLTMKDFFSKKK